MVNKQMMERAVQFERQGDFMQAEAMRQAAATFEMPDSETRTRLLRTFAREAKQRGDVNVARPQGYRFIDR